MRFPLLVSLLSLCGAAGLAGQGKPVLGKGPFNGLQARVTAIRFFESAGGVLAPKDRVIATRFDALTTRFINLELELEYAKAAKPTPFEVECRFEGAHGTAQTLSLSGTVQAGWTGSYHAGGVGSPERGGWAAGIYKVNCREGGQLIAAAQLEVIKSTAAVRKLGAAVVQMKFFQSLGERLPVETRRYSSRFDAGTARWIKTEFALVYPQAATEVSFVVECAYVFPDNSVRRVAVERRIPGGWTGSVHAQGIGWDEAGHWPAGKYKVSCWNNGERMSEGGFEVFAAGSSSRESPAGRLRFYGRKADDSVTAPAYAAAFEAGTFDTLYVEASVPLRAAVDSASFGCLVTDPAGITSAFTVKGEVREKEKALVASGPAGMLDAPKLRGSYQVECRTGARGLAVDRFEIRAKPDIPELDARVMSVGLFAGNEEPPGDEAVSDVVFSAVKLKSLWVVAILERASAQGPGALPYSCRVTGARNVVVATSTQPATIPAQGGPIVLEQRLDPVAKQRWTAGKLVLSCTAGSIALLKQPFELTR